MGLVLSLSLIVLYAAIVAVFAVNQAKLIFPGQQTQNHPDSVVSPKPGTELVRLKTAKGDPVVGLFGPALTADGRPHPDPSSRPTILDFYGNGMCLKTALGGFEDFRRLGANVLIAEYAGYGMRGGSPSEANCYATADAFYDYLAKRPDVHPKKIVAVGWSLGGAVATDLASRKPVAGLVSYCAFTSMADAARVHYPYLPASLLLSHRFESERKIARVRCPILIGHGRRDELVPYAMSDRLASAAGGPVTRFAVDDADHTDFFANGEAKVLKTLGTFLDDLR